ncbi:MAG TPA: hypothetical protein VLG47_03465 [Candidatus Saccharimonadales bacterium]|nr:hypothetical protein [Candidatus Saccharimonadales bacterium]
MKASRTKRKSRSRIAFAKQHYLILAVATGVALIALIVPKIQHTYNTAAEPVNQICTVESTSICLNRKGGGFQPGTTPIIGYKADDINNNFKYAFMTDHCNHGHVTDGRNGENGGKMCPFTTYRLNHGNYSRWILKIEQAGVANPLCVGDQDANSAADLTWCPDNGGQHGATGTQFIAIGSPLSSTGRFQLVNVFWSDNPNGGVGVQGRWMCVPNTRTSIFFLYFSGSGTGCTFYQKNRPVAL